MSGPGAIIPIAIGGAALFALSGKGSKSTRAEKNKFGITVAPGCKSVDFHNHALFREYLRSTTSEKGLTESPQSVLETASRTFRAMAPGCESFPQNPSSRDAAELYSLILNYTIGLVARRPGDRQQIYFGVVDPKTGVKFSDWYKEWRGYPSASAGGDSEDYITFSKDFYTYSFGKDWESEVLLPFISRQLSDGRAPHSLEDFFLNGKVVVDGALFPMTELPLGNPVVKMFILHLEAQILNALAMLTPAEGDFLWMDDGEGVRERNQCQGIYIGRDWVEGYLDPYISSLIASGVEFTPQQVANDIVFGGGASDLPGAISDYCDANAPAVMNFWNHVMNRAASMVP